MLNSSLAISLLLEEVPGVCHRLELEVVAAGVLEKHGPLLARKAHEAQVRLNDKLPSKKKGESILSATTFSQLM